MGRTECTILGFVASPIGCVSCVLVRVSAVYRLWRQLVPTPEEPRGKVAYLVSKLRCSITQDTNAACPRNIPVFMHAEDCVLVEDDDWAPCAVVRLRIADPLRIKCWPTDRPTDRRRNGFFFVPMVRLWLPKREREKRERERERASLNPRSRRRLPESSRPEHGRRRVGERGQLTLLTYMLLFVMQAMTKSFSEQLD